MDGLAEERRGEQEAIEARERVEQKGGKDGPAKDGGGVAEDKKGTSFNKKGGGQVQKNRQRKASSSYGDRETESEALVTDLLSPPSKTFLWAHKRVPGLGPHIPAMLFVCTFVLRPRPCPSLLCPSVLGPSFLCPSVIRHYPFVLSLSVLLSFVLALVLLLCPLCLCVLRASVIL